MTSRCTCPNGLSGKCSHLAAIYLTALNNVSVTDLPCSWKRSKTQAVTQVVPRQNFCSVLTRKLDDVDINSLKDGINSLPHSSGMKFMVDSMAFQSPQIISDFPVMQSLISKCYSEMNFLTTKFVLNRMRLSQVEIENISKQTTKQSKCELWLSLRYGRITASNFGKILGSRNITNTIRSMFEQKNLQGVLSIKWGRDKEVEAIQQFKDETGLNVQSSGLFLTQSGILGASPDGLIGDDSVLEVKCPYKIRDKEIRKSITKDFYLHEENYNLKLKENHNYYHQIQWQLYITGRQCFVGRRSTSHYILIS